MQGRYSARMLRMMSVVVAAAAVLATTSCSSDKSSESNASDAKGEATKIESKTVGKHIAKSPAELLLPIDQFPADFPAQALSEDKKAEVLKHLSHAPEVKVEPASCAPAANTLPKLPPSELAMVTGINGKSMETIAIVVSRSTGDFDKRKQLYQSCPNVTMTTKGGPVHAQITMLPEPKVDADASYGARTTAGSTTTIQLIAQVGDIVITGMENAFGKPPTATATAALEQTFAKAVARVRAAA